MPIASESSATSVTPGSRPRLRSAILTSCRSVSSIRPPRTLYRTAAGTLSRAHKVRHAVGGVAREVRSLPHQPVDSVSRAGLHPLVSGARAVPDVLHEHRAAGGVSGHVARIARRQPAAV